MERDENLSIETVSQGGTVRQGSSHVAVTCQPDGMARRPECPSQSTGDGQGQFLFGQARLSDGAGIFDGLPDGFEATRYHSLVVERSSLPENLEVTAWTGDADVMAIRDRERLHFGVQFHPESYLCHEGKRLLARFLEIAGLPVHEKWRDGSRKSSEFGIRNSE